MTIRPGIARLDAYYDDNENRFDITPESIDRAIEEEKAKERRDGYPGSGRESLSHQPVDNQARRKRPTGRTSPDAFRPGDDANDTASIRELQASSATPRSRAAPRRFYIDRLEGERTHMLERIESTSQRIGHLETRLQLGGGRGGTGAANRRRSLRTRSPRPVAYAHETRMATAR